MLPLAVTFYTYMQLTNPVVAAGLLFVTGVNFTLVRLIVRDAVRS